MKIAAETLSKAREVAHHYAGRTVLVTGASGMIGRNVVSLLLQLNDAFSLGIKILAHGRNEDKLRDVFGAFLGRSDLYLAIGDITSLSVTCKVDFIVHTAYVTGGSKQHLEFPLRTISVALDGTRTILELAHRDDAAAIFLSSLEVYGFTGNRKDPISENEMGYIDCTNVRSSYSESKRMCECLFASYAKQYGMKTYIARVAPSFGPGVSINDNRVFSQMARSVLAGEDIVLKSSGETVRSYCDVEDVALALLFIMAKGEVAVPYNIANMNAKISIRDLAELFVSRSGQPSLKVKIDGDADASKLGYNKVMNNALDARRLMGIGWTPTFGIEDMVSRLLHFLSSQEA